MLLLWRDRAALFWRFGWMGCIPMVHPFAKSRGFTYLIQNKQLGEIKIIYFRLNFSIYKKFKNKKLEQF